MGRSGATMTVVYVFLAIFVLVSNSVAEGDADMSSDRDQTLSGLELFLKREMYDILKEYPSLLKSISLNDPELSEIQNSRYKRGPAMAGLENLDFMTGIFSRLPMRTNAALSDIRERMRAAGRKRK